MKNFFFSIFILVMFLMQESSASVSFPHIPRVGSNLVQNSDISGTSGWEFDGTATYDNSVTRTSGSGSFKFTAPGWQNAATMSSGVSVTPGSTYTVSAYMKLDTWPHQIRILFKSYDASQGKWINGDVKNFGTTKAGIWQEVDMIYTAPPWASEFKAVFFSTVSPNESTAVWVDDVYIGKGIGFEQPPTERVPFEGSHVRVDELGNFEVYKEVSSGVFDWVPFFPLCMYGDDERTDWTIYSEAGWNVEMRAQNADTVAKAKRAVSKYNPDGMMSGINLSQYTFDVSYWLPGYKDTATFRQVLKDIKSRGLMDHVLLYYLDNENNHHEWETVKNVMDIIKQEDIYNGKRGNPIYTLQGQVGLARQHAAAGFQDITGTYVKDEDLHTVPAGPLPWFTALQNMEGLTSPVCIAQINGDSVDANEVIDRVIIYRCLISGAKAFGHWKDGGVLGPIEKKAWWSNFHVFREEIDELLPILRMPHWTQWKLVADKDSINIGTRDYNGEGYALILNESSKTRDINFTLSGLPYTPTSIRNYLKGGTIALNNLSFSLSLNAGKSIVLCFTNPAVPSVTNRIPKNYVNFQSGGISVYNVFGQLIKNIQVGENINLRKNNLSSQIYFYKINEYGNWVKKRNLIK